MYISIYTYVYIDMYIYTYIFKVGSPASSLEEREVQFHLKWFNLFSFILYKTM
jgi:hypothetical protein